MLRLKIKITALCAIGMITQLQADPKVLKGQTYQVPKNKATQIPGLFKSSNHRAALACPPPLPNITFNSSVPLPNPNALPGAFFPNTSVSNQLVPPPQTLGFNFVAGNQGINPQFLGTPPDTFGVKGLTQFVMGINQGYVSFNPNGTADNILYSEAGTLSNLDGNLTVFLENADARIRYDRLANRFVIINAIFDYGGSNGYGGFSISVSDSGILTDDTQWTVFTIYDLSVVPDENGCAGDVASPVQAGVDYDYPCLGIDANALYIGYSVLENSGPWISNTLFVIQKESLYSGNGPVVINVFRDITKTPDGNFIGDQVAYRNDATVFPLDNYDDPNPAFGYALCQDPIYFGKLNLFRILDAGSTSPSLVGPLGIDVMQTYTKASNTLPLLNQVYGKYGSLERNDDRLADSSHINKKQIYTSHTVDVDNTGVATSAINSRTGIRWYQLDVTGDPTGQGLGTETATTVPALVQAGTLFDPAISNPLYYGWSAIMSNSQGDISLCGTVSSVNNSPSAFFVGKAGNDPKDGTLKIGTTPPNVYAVGNGHFTRSLGAANEGAQRWGDMSFSSLDPVDKKTIWTIQEICAFGVETVVAAQLLAP